MKKHFPFVIAAIIAATIALSAQKNVGTPGYFPAASAVSSSGTLSTTCFKFPSLTQICESSDGVLRLLDAAGATFTRLQFGGTTSSFPALARSGVTLIAQRADGASNTSFAAATLSPTDAQITNGSGTGITVSGQSGQLQRTVYKVTIDRLAFICAALTCDVTIGTITAKTILLGAFGDLTQVFACSATCTTATLSMQLGNGGGAQYLASFDADAAVDVRGNADAEMGTELVRAAAYQGGVVPSWAGTVPVTVRLTSGTGNVGTGAATNLSTGSITFYLATEKLP